MFLPSGTSAGSQRHSRGCLQDRVPFQKCTRAWYLHRLIIFAEWCHALFIPCIVSTGLIMCCRSLPPWGDASRAAKGKCLYAAFFTAAPTKSKLLDATAEWLCRFWVWTCHSNAGTHITSCPRQVASETSNAKLALLFSKALLPSLALPYALPPTGHAATGKRYLLFGSDLEAMKAQFLKFFSHQDWKASRALQVTSYLSCA